MLFYNSWNQYKWQECLDTVYLRLSLGISNNSHDITFGVNQMSKVSKHYFNAKDVTTIMCMWGEYIQLPVARDPGGEKASVANIYGV